MKIQLSFALQAATRLARAGRGDFGGIPRSSWQLHPPAFLAGLVLATLSFPMIGASQVAAAADFSAVTTGAAAARDRGDLPRAIQLYQQAVDLNPKWAEGWWSLGTLQYSTDQYSAAREALTRFIDLTPNAGPALALRGLCEYESGQYPESLLDLQNGIALGAANQPRNAQIVLYHEALVLTRLGRFEEATAKYIFFVKHANPNRELAISIGLAGMRMAMLPKDIDPSQADLIAEVGNAAIPVMNGDLAAGQQAFQEFFTRNPTLPNVHYFYGYLLFAAHSDDAIPQFQQELALSPHNAVFNAMLAWAQGLQGDYAAALPAAKSAVTEDPSLSMGQLMYGRALVETGQVEAGLPYLESVLRQEPGNLEAHITLAKAYSKLGRVDDARQERQLCLRMADDQVASQGSATQQAANQQGANQSANQGAAPSATP